MVLSRDNGGPGAMGKFRCPCGQTISDIEHPRPNAGRLVKEQDEESYFGGAARELAGLVAAVTAGTRDEWIRERFGDDYPKDLDDESVIWDLFTAYNVEYTLLVDECEGCGRLHVQSRPGSSRAASYAPDSKRPAGILRSASPAAK